MQNNENYTWRTYVIGFVLVLGVVGLLWRLLDLTIFNRHFLLQQSNARVLRIISTPAYRGMITDRNGIPLAISTPVDSVWIDPQIFSPTAAQYQQLSQLLNMPVSAIKQPNNTDDKREFVYLRRGMPPEIAVQIKQLNIPGIFLQRDYRRYYPEGEVTAHVVGFTNIDDYGQEGLELQYDKDLRGMPGKEQVLKDRLGHIIQIVHVISDPIQGREMTLSIDNRIQYLAYRALVDAVQKSNASSGSVVVLNPKTGEVLAMVNYPSYNPNQRPAGESANYRNRAVTDLYEPGSTIKSFGVVNALESGKYTPNTLVDTNPGVLTVDGKEIHDDVPDNGVLTLWQVLQKSSNIGIAKVTLTLPPDSLPILLKAAGFGHPSNSGFPGEVSGYLPTQKHWRPITIAHLAFGYGISVTALQLAHAYTIFANHGVMAPITFLKVNQPVVGKQIIPPAIALTMLPILESVVDKQGAGAPSARIAGYTVGGKTGTSYTAIPGGYDKTHYNSSFVGFAPATNPQFVIAVALHGVHGSVHFGAQVGAPVFAQIMGATLRLMDVQPDALATLNPQTMSRTK